MGQAQQIPYSRQQPTGQLAIGVQEEETPSQYRQMLKQSQSTVWQKRHLLVRQFMEHVPSACIAMDTLHLRTVMVARVYVERSIEVEAIGCVCNDASRMNMQLIVKGHLMLKGDSQCLRYWAQDPVLVSCSTLNSPTQHPVVLKVYRIVISVLFSRAAVLFVKLRTFIDGSRLYQLLPCHAFRRMYWP